MKKQFIQVTIGLWLTFLFAACSSTVRTPAPSVPTIGPLVDQPITYWDMGVSLRFPSTWSAPFYGQGQLLLAPNIEATRQNPPLDPLISLQISTLSNLNITKDTTLIQIATLISGAHANSKILQSGKAGFAGLDAAFIDLQDPDSGLLEQAIAFRLPDGRIGWLIGVAPSNIWANFAPTFDQVRASGTLIRPSTYMGIADSVQNITFAPEKLQLNAPVQWKSIPIDDSTILLHDPSDVLYHDQSGFANGPQVVVSVADQQSGSDLKTAFNQAIALKAGTAITEGSANGISTVSFTRRDAVSDQQLTFIGFLVPGKSRLVLIRWTTPGQSTAHNRFWTSYSRR